MKSRRAEIMFKITRDAVGFLPHVLLAFMLASVLSLTSFASESDEPQNGSANEYSTLPCGTNCLYACLSFFGIEADYRKLLETCVDHHNGSSMGVLVKRAREYGLYALPMTDMALMDIRNSPYPAILHVRKSIDSFQFDHFEVLIPSDSENLVLYDPPNPSREVGDREIADRWSGSAILLSDVPISTRFLWFPTIARLAAVVLTIGMGTFLVYVGHSKIRRVQSRPRRLGMQLAWIGVLALTAAAGGHSLLNGGLVVQRRAVAEALSTIPEEQFGTVSASELETAVKEGAVLVDARLKGDFDAGHIEGAINLPVDYPDAILGDRVGELPRDRLLIVYCQSTGCPFDTRVAQKLYTLGFTNISIYAGGWLEWKSIKDWSQFLESQTSLAE